jgi:tRNA(fMet)-specific endonuclease VapC
MYARQKCDSGRRQIGPHDLLIASHARASGLTLVTNNLDEFRRVSKLNLANCL